MRGKQRFEVIDPAMLAPKSIESERATVPTSVGEHTRVEQETITEDCWLGECECDLDGSQDHPRRTIGICVECTAEREAEYGDAGGVEPWPCPESGDSQP